MSIHRAVARRALQGALGWLLVGTLLLPTFGRAAGEDVGDPRQQVAGAQGKPSEGTPLRKISPYAKVARERAQAPKPEHRPNLRLSVRGAQRSGR